MFLACVVPALAAVNVSGTVVAREGGRLKPVFRAEVIAREASSAEIAAVARTDRDGRFLITELASPKVALSVEKPRYFTASANGREGENLTLDCTAPEDCSDVRFELGVGAIVSGMVRDEFGEPVSMAMVRVALPDEAQQQEPRRPMRRSGFAMTDDRGYFRFFGLKPGAYVVKAERPNRGPMERMGFEGQPVDIEVAEGAEVHGILITGRREESSRRFSVSGKITGVDVSGSDAGFVSIQTVGPAGMWGGYSTGAGINQDGSFLFQNLAPGRYAFSFVRRGNRGSPWDNSLSLGVIEVQGDLSGLILQPAAQTGFSGVLKFESGAGPPEVVVSATSSDSWRPFTAVAKGPDYRFEIANLIPGTYSLEASQGARFFSRDSDPGEFFVRGIRRGSEVTPARDITLPEGKVEQVELVISNEFSRVYGRVKAAGEAAPGGAVRRGAQFQVGLAGPRGFRVVQADQNAEFVFERTVPGPYRICAWSDPDPQPIYDEKTWEAAGAAVRKFEVEAGSEVEINLTAVP